MTRGRQLAAAAFAALAGLASLGTKADAAQCGSSAAGFESWKGQFAEEARAKGIGASAVSALMGANYASATIAADRGQRSFGRSLDQFLAKRGASSIVARGRGLKQSQAALFSSIEQRYGVPPGPLLAIWGWRRVLEASAAIRTCCRPSPRSPMTVGGANISPSSSTPP
jgi:membrane-bound lytic murein transglycosylase B